MKAIFFIFLFLISVQSNAECRGKGATTRELVQLLNNPALFKLPSESIVLSDFKTNYGFMDLVAHKRKCTLGVCTKWERYYLSAPGNTLRPELKIENQNLILKLEKKCQGSYGHGTTCLINRGNVNCKYIPGTPQCGGWHADNALLTFKGKITKKCLYLKHETENLRIELKTKFFEN